ncbi:MAG TPA: GH1 family beta-glucosidase [Propionibacteriaceae bacterium]
MTDYREPGRRFADDFIFGTATAAYQIEGAPTEDGRLPSIWDTFSHTPGRTLGGETGDVACDSYHRWESDLDLMASYGIDAYRFSIAWPRIVPNGTGTVNQAGLDFYSRFVDGLLERGVKPIVTLYHWDLPQALEDAGGWPERATAEAFAAYAKVVGEALGDRVDTWTTLNEPWCAAYLGYGVGVHAPGRSDPVAALRAVHHLNLGHGLAVQALRSSVSPEAKMSITNNLSTVRAASDDPADIHAADKARALSNGVFTGPQLRGEYPALAFEVTSKLTDWSFVLDGDLDAIHQPIDVFGLNWYTPRTVRQGTPPEPTPTPMPSVSPGNEDVEDVFEEGDRTEMGWIVDPSGLEELLVDLDREFPGLPIVITENGCAYDDPVVDGRCRDVRRIDYLQRHVTAVHRAIEAGANVVGYFVWSLMDNYEWSFGYSKRFGITHVDFETQRRTPRDSALWYTKLARTHEIPEADGF